MSTELFETKPRWPGCPPICIRVNLPAFKTEKELYKFANDNHPSIPVAHVGRCKFCDHFHYRTEKTEAKAPPAPAEAKAKTAPKSEPKTGKAVGIPTRERQSSMFDAEK